MNKPGTIHISNRMIKTIVIILLTYMIACITPFLLIVSPNTIIKIISIITIAYFYIRSVRQIIDDKVDIIQEGYTIRLDYFIIMLLILSISYGRLYTDNRINRDWVRNRSLLLSIYEDPLNPTMMFFDQTLSTEKIDPESKLIYYHGMYLPPTYILKILLTFHTINDIELLSWLLSMSFFLWSMIGLILSLLLAPIILKSLFNIVIIGKSWGIFFIALLLLTGLNFWYKIFWIILLIQAKIDMSEKYYYIERALITQNEIFTPYYAPLGNFISYWQWTPQHLIPCLITLSLISVYKKNLLKFPLALCSTFLISSTVFSWVGIMMVYSYYLIAKLIPDRKHIKNINRGIIKSFVELSVTIGFVILILLFYLNKQYPPPSISLNPYLFMNIGLFRYIFYIFMELIPFALIVLICRLKQLHIPSIIWTSIIAVMTISLFDYGMFNDTTKILIPFMMILTLFSAYVITLIIKDNTVHIRVLLIFYLILVLPSGLSEILDGLTLDNIDTPLLEYNEIYILMLAGAEQPLNPNKIITRILANIE